MEVFEGVEFVRLRSLEHGTYLHADEDGLVVSLRPRRASPNAAGVVRRVQRSGVAHLVLRGAYGRYLALSLYRGGRRIVQRGGDAATAWWWCTPR